MKCVRINKELKITIPAGTIEAVDGFRGTNSDGMLSLIGAIGNDDYFTIHFDVREFITLFPEIFEEVDCSCLTDYTQITTEVKE